ncbi:tRNA lysidine(34) synthetase TilS [Levilactobacillus acidifarinae]|uniref:tRNA(Ile)-lysidine synthase n=1 Tax=Levilactobacillus acidifarinae DSM 19394 = JCM 15949 TaxID=1423715 RepID=A0A0R1LVE3_9LACO|nr:tRNA lysidine(34) synthetase TilS [Levilactobacillus acidifarinae]KRK95559.1 tRNA(Ile)-lysidine synthetase, MesJ [Levilactobacillus acidifarinae DSM 19394]GEO70196.1 tRNA(Ile)-lysidine synthase [Levilactobacillus acidifarinae]
MTLAADFRQHWHDQAWGGPQRLGLVAVSTGVDSMVLLALLLGLPRAERPQLTVVHVNHELRAQSREEEAFLMRWCAQAGVPLVVKHWPLVDHPAHGMEAAARQFRYAFFAAQLQAQTADWVATAHQADEQAETMLLKLLRGGQLDQLTGMAPSRPLPPGRVIHPLLPFTKAQLLEYAQQHQIPWYEDATNQTMVASRNRVRHQILPALKRENPRVIDHLGDYGQQLAAVLAVADRTLDAELATLMTSRHPATGQIAPLLARSPGEQRLLLARLIKRVAPAISARPAHLTQALQLLGNPQRATGTVALGAGWQISKEYRTFYVKKAEKFGKKSVSDFSFMVDLNQWQSVGDNWLLGVFSAPVAAERTHQIGLTISDWPLTVRPWRSGDRLQLAGGHHQAVRRALINAKVPQQQRSQVAVLVTAQGTVLAALGVKWSVLPPRQHTTTYYIGIQSVLAKGEQHE